MKEKEVELREKLVKLYGEIEGITANPDANGEDIARGISMNEETVTLENELRDVQTLLRAADRKAEFTSSNGTHASQQTALKEAEPVRDTRPLGKRFADFAAEPAFRAFARDPRGSSPAFELEGESLLEARTLIYGGALSADQVRPELLGGIYRGNEPIGTDAVRRVLLSGTTTSDSITYISENVYTNAAVAVAEAVSTVTGGKPESALTFTQATDLIQIIAHWIPITRNALDDLAMLQSYVEGRLLDGLVRTENNQLLKGDGTAPNISGILDRSGIQTLDQAYFTGAAVQNPGAGGPENYNRILRAKTLISTTGDSTASFVIVNPTDWETLLTLADTTDNYFGLGPFAAATPPRIWNLEVVITEEMTAGNVLVGDGTAAQVFDRQSARILVADQHSDFFIRNIIVLLAEERIGLAVYRPAAFALTDLV